MTRDTLAAVQAHDRDTAARTLPALDRAARYNLDTLAVLDGLAAALEMYADTLDGPGHHHPESENNHT